MVRAERNEYRARERALDERDHQVLLLLLEHKVLTTHQIASLCFKSLRRCQHRMRELKDLGLVSSFSVGRGFGEGRAPACWYLTKPGLVEIADAKDVRTSDLPWVPDSSCRSNKLLVHRLGVNAFFCALAEASRAFQATAWPPGGPSTGSGRRLRRSNPTDSAGTCIRAERASSTWSTTGPPRPPARCRESSRAT
jgi:Replication-relaxation